MAGGTAITGAIDRQLSPPGYFRHPAIQSRWLQWRNALRRHPTLYPALILLPAAYAWACSTAAARALMQAAAAHWLLTALVWAVLCAAWAMRTKGRTQQRQLHSWLAALPVPDRTLAAAVCVPVGAVCVCFLAIAIGFGAGLAGAVAATLLLSVGAAGALGVGIGWYWPRKPAPMVPPSWYTRVRINPRATWRAWLWGLATWPLAHGQVWGRPKVKARQLAFLALGLPMGISAIQALLVISIALIVSYLLRLLAATARVAFPAARWLAPTPIGVVRLTGALIWLALLRQLVVIALLEVFVSALPHAVTAAQALISGAAWLLLALIVSLAACAIAYGRSSPDRSHWLLPHGRRHRVHAQP